jgi:hypothetical protein
VSKRRRVIKKRLKRLFPELRGSDFRLTSRATALYNCIAWAVGVNDDWWEYRHPYTWPKAPRNPTVAAAIAVFVGQGFEQCADASPEVGWHKVAVYGDASGYTHAAKQLPNGRWSSKLGKLQDIEHDTLESLYNTDYGKVVCILRKRAKE